MNTEELYFKYGVPLERYIPEMDIWVKDDNPNFEVGKIFRVDSDFMEDLSEH